MTEDRMQIITDKDEFMKWNCLYCRHYEHPENARPCNESIPFLFCGRMWYPEYCPFMDRRPLTDKELEELDRMLDVLAGDKSSGLWSRP